MKKLIQERKNKKVLGSANAVPGIFLLGVDKNNDEYIDRMYVYLYTCNRVSQN